jgi:hypothetical protein
VPDFAPALGGGEFHLDPLGQIGIEGRPPQDQAGQRIPVEGFEAAREGRPLVEGRPRLDGGQKGRHDVLAGIAPFVRAGAGGRGDPAVIEPYRDPVGIDIAAGHRRADRVAPGHEVRHGAVVAIGAAAREHRGFGEGADRGLIRQRARRFSRHPRPPVRAEVGTPLAGPRSTGDPNPRILSWPTT